MICGKAHKTGRGFFSHIIVGLLACGLIAWFACPSAMAGQSHVGRVVFSASQAGQWDLWSLDPVSLDLIQLTDTHEVERFPAVSPGGQKLAYISDRNEIRVMDLITGKLETVPLPKGIYAHPAWAPDGQELAFVEYQVIPSDSSEIWRIAYVEGRWETVRRITSFPPMYTFPAYSPDGKSIACAQFHRDRLLGVIEEIGLVRFDDGRFQALTQDNADSFFPAWSPDGNKLAYTSNVEGNFEVWTMDLSGSERERISRSPSYDGEPSWSPDGRELVFVSNRTGHRELWIATPSGDQERQLTQMEQTCAHPFWVK